eukprot:CAMPEP_0172485306 /NCGR_PEP_ID=MMETSP1066-20121228/13305_1 /TAXON_ID=671091 /ORGANISM="Coscinodiscus wailesii, Strain CCMP2513" /LENGTH=63 /DNA_ID=CAMNT_0013250489 /DNA_START=230 /DNA_END=421 /DNA_ORIENTATION=+
MGAIILDKERDKPPVTAPHKQTENYNVTSETPIPESDKLSEFPELVNKHLGDHQPKKERIYAG